MRRTPKKDMDDDKGAVSHDEAGSYFSVGGRLLTRLNVHQLAPSAPPTTMRCARASSPPSSASGSIGRDSERRRKRGLPSSSSSRGKVFLEAPEFSSPILIAGAGGHGSVRFRTRGRRSARHRGRRRTSRAAGGTRASASCVAGSPPRHAGSSRRRCG